MRIENLEHDAVSIAQQLIRFHTVNGEDQERSCILFIKDLLDRAGIETQLIWRDERRPNLFARYPAKLQSDGIEIPPFLMYGHVDVVSVKEQKWEKDPFSGMIEDGYLFGRGAIDMKGEHGMFLSALLHLAEEKVRLPFDVCYLAVSDEEGSSDFGMKYLVENHAELFSEFHYAIGEIGGFSINVAGKKFYPIQIAEKQVAEIKITARGEGGHGSMKHSSTAMEKMAVAVAALSTKRLPVRVTAPVKMMIGKMSEELGGIKGKLLKGLLNPGMTDRLLDLLGDAGEIFDPLLHNSINVTIIGGGDAVNVIPAAVWCKCDYRIVPQCSIEEALEDIKSVIGEDFEIEVIRFDEGQAEADMKLFASMAQAVREADPDGCPVPFVLAAVTDSRFLSRLGVQTYGFTPMKLPEDYNFTSMAHNANEKVPVDALIFGAELIYRYIVRDYAECFRKNSDDILIAEIE